MQPVVHGIGASQNGAVRGQGHWHYRIGVGKPHTVGGQSINVRCADVLISITAQVVSSQGVDGDKDDVGLLSRIRRSPEGGTEQQACQKQSMKHAKKLYYDGYSSGIREQFTTT